MERRTRSATQRCQNNSQMHIKHNRIGRSSVAILICLLVSGIAKTNAVPTDSAGGAVARGQRSLRDVSAAGLLQEEPKDAAAAAAATETAADQPQGQCLLDGVLVEGTSVSCEKQVGCRAIQKTGHCCPDYKCDCEKDGKTYLNGDKLVDPETPCTVCYCQGGEILCSSVTCFIRDDCKPKYIAGRCCPAYDNCPVSIFDNNNNHNNNNGANTTLLHPSVPVPSAANAPAQPAVPVDLLNPKITIKEITKPIEIRITDDNKAIPIHQMLKPSTAAPAAGSPTTTPAPAPASVPSPPQQQPSPAAAATTPAPPLASTTTPGIDEFVFGESALATTIASADSNRKAQPLPLPVGGINTESLKLTASVAYANPVFEKIPPAAPPATESTLKTDVSAEDSAEAPQSVIPADGPISVFGSQGLQHVDSDAASDPSKVNIKRENLAAIEVVPGANTPSAGDAPDFGSSEVIYARPVTVPAEPSGSLQQSALDVEPDTAGSDNIYHIILTTAGPRVDASTEGFSQFKSSTEGIDDPSAPVNANASDNAPLSLSSSPLAQSTTEGPNTFDNSTSAASASTSGLPSTTQHSAAASEPSTTDNTPAASSTDANKLSTDGAHHLEEEEAAIPAEANPAYPSLPEDDFSLRETDDAVEPEIKDEPRSIGGGAFDVPKSTKHLVNHAAGFGSLEGSGSGGGMLIDGDTASTTAAPAQLGAAHHHSTEGAPSDIPLLLNSAEDLSAETTIANSSDFQLEKIMKDAENETGSGDSLEPQSLEALISSESGSGELTSAEAAPTSKKQREPTTPRPTRHVNSDLDIDELDNASGDGKCEPLEDPKLDAESLKLDDSPEEDVVQQDAAGQAGVQAVKTNAAQEKTLVEEAAAPVGDGGGSEPRLLLQRFI